MMQSVTLAKMESCPEPLLLWPITRTGEFNSALSRLSFTLGAPQHCRVVRDLLLHCERRQDGDVRLGLQPKGLHSQWNMVA